MSSIVPLASREIREALKAKSIAMLGTPVSGDKVIFDKYYALMKAMARFCSTYRRYLSQATSQNWSIR